MQGIICKTEKEILDKIRQTGKRPSDWLGLHRTAKMLTAMKYSDPRRRTPVLTKNRTSQPLTQATPIGSSSLQRLDLASSQPALQCAVRFTIQVQNLTIKYQNTAYLEKIVDFILLFLLHWNHLISRYRGAVPRRESTQANPPTQAYKRHEPPIRKHARGKEKPAEAMPSTCQEKEPETQWKNQKQQN